MTVLEGIKNIIQLAKDRNKTIKEIHITPSTHYTLLKEELAIDNVEGFPLIINEHAGTGVYVIYEKEEIKQT